MGGSRKYTSKHNPQIGRGAKLGTHYSAKDRTCASNIEELYHKHCPIGHCHIVDAVGACDGGSRTVVGSKYMFDEASIKQVAGN